MHIVGLITRLTDAMDRQTQWGLQEVHDPAPESDIPMRSSEKRIRARGSEMEVSSYTFLRAGEGFTVQVIFIARIFGFQEWGREEGREPDV